MAAGVHAHRAADGTRHSDRPLEAREAGGRRSAREDRQRRGGARRHRGAADGDVFERLAQGDRQPREPGVGDKQIRAVADDQGRHAARADRLCDASEVVVGFDAHEQLGGTSDPVRRQRSDGHVALRSIAE